MTCRFMRQDISLIEITMKLKSLSERRYGSIIRSQYVCPCGKGIIVEEQDYTEGHRDCWVSLNCDICQTCYKLIFSDSGLSWNIVKIVSAPTEQSKELYRTGVLICRILMLQTQITLYR